MPGPRAQPLTPYERLGAFIVFTVFVGVFMFKSAGDPSMDDFLRGAGIVAGFGAFIFRPTVFSEILEFAASFIKRGFGGGK